jgi:hypothetical protein
MRADAQHIAIATVARVDVLVRWNLKHIVNLRRIRGYNSVNLRRGYATLRSNLMSQVPSETPDLSPASLHFQILLSGTVVFLVALFWLTDLPHTNTYEALVAAAVSRAVIGIQTLGCYLAFVSVVLGHKVLRRSGQSRSEEQA